MTAGTRIALAYLFMALLGLALIAPTMPPFQNADETNHLFRADQISHLGFLPQRLPDGEHGGWVDSGLVHTTAPFEALHFHPETKMTRALAAPQPWGLPVPAGFPNTAIYPPVLYLPQAAALYAARHWPLTVLQGATLARLAAGLASICLGAAAISLCTGGAIWLYAILLLPMSLALTASASQDGLILGTTALAAALAQRLRRAPSPALFALATLLLALIACARPPYAGFAATLLLARLALPYRLLGIGTVCAAAIAWSTLVAPHVVLPVFPQGAANPTAQALGLLRAPWHFPTLIAATWHAHGPELAHEFIGKLGWLDTDLPPFFHTLAWTMLAIAAVLAAGTWQRPAGRAWFALWGIIAAIFGIVLIQYLTWTLPGASVIDGLQGRYFLPPALMLAALLPAARQQAITLLPVLLFPALGIAVTLHAIIMRYYM